MDYLPHDRRHFIHRKLIGFIPGPIGGIVRGIVGPGGNGGRGGKTIRQGIGGCPPGSWRDHTGGCRTDRGANSPSNPVRYIDAPAPPRAIVRTRMGADCVIPGQRLDQFGKCSFFLGERLGPDDAPVGDVVMGRYGAAYVPGSMVVDRAVCLAGDVVANDGLCYPKGKKGMVRMWKPAPKPLVTGGERKAVATANRVASKMTRMAVRLQEMGMIKKPIARKPKKKAVC